MASVGIICIHVSYAVLFLCSHRSATSTLQHCRPGAQSEGESSVTDDVTSSSRQQQQQPVAADVGDDADAPPDYVDDVATESATSLLTLSLVVGCVPSPPPYQPYTVTSVSDSDGGEWIELQCLDAPPPPYVP